ncbi:FtsZ family, C-terminal domain [Oscillospiraceae bacterium]|nr:FtsZ family, C-terminal domain [Oscillospiraceae bacterium]
MSDNKRGFVLDEEHFATIKVIGCGGGGCNAVDRMLDSGVQGIDFISINSDNQALARSKAPIRIQIGEKVTRGLGCGADPSVGEKAAEESKDEIAEAISNTDMLFITAGMGGGTGTGAAPVVAQIAQELGILTVAVVTRPFGFEGARRAQNAERGIRELEKYVDSLVVVSNDKLLEVVDEDTSFEDAFNMADQVLKFGVAGISDLVAIPGLINLDLADVRRVMTKAGVCHMGIGRASGEGRATAAVKQAINSPLLDTTIEGANGVIVNFTGGRNMKLQEIDMAAKLVREAVAPEAEIIVGAVIDTSLEDEIMITVIASGFDNSVNASAGHRASTSVLSRNNPQLITEQPARNPAPVQSRNTYAARNVQAEPEPQPARHQASQGFLFGDDSVNQVHARAAAPVTPAPAPAPAPAPQPIPQAAPIPQPAPAPVPPYQAPQQAPAAPAPQNQMGGRPQANIQPQAAPASEQPKSAKPWFMFGRDNEN